VISVPFTGDEGLWEYDVHYRDLWELAADMLRNPWLFPHFTFDAHRLSVISQILDLSYSRIYGLILRLGS
jgi:hypothetical protein